MKETAKWYTPAGKSINLYHDMTMQPHILIAGATGSGKSTVLHALIYHVLFNAPQDSKQGAQLILCDPKRVELARYKHLPHVVKYATDTAGIASALQYANLLMENRYTDMERRGLVEYDGGEVYVVIDEFAKLMVKAQDKEETRLRRLCESMIEAIGDLGRAAHVHLVLASQAPNRNTVKANIALNLTARLALRCDTAIESRQIIGTSGAELLPDPLEEHRAEGIYKHGFKTDRYLLPIIPAEDITARIEWWMNQVRPVGIISRLFGRAV